MEKRIRWREDINEDTSKPIYVAMNSKNEDLGWLERERVGAHMHWCWQQFKDIMMSPGCLQEVRDRQKALFNTSKR